MKDRIKILIGSLIAVIGVFLTLIVGAFYGYANGVIELGGIALIVLGLLLAKSRALADFLGDVLRF